ncbi:uncharacterized protein [Fopius arisanus]|uniref:Uncharacterized protein n=1 Tax=Fopius arisanus TaxID=64838 RepID=A0A9R1UC34_9HYME|nr:PREDICTED: uncharacterized protein LOC105274243 [Fopius arisanus]
MENIFQNTNVWVAEVGEALHRYSSATVNFVIETIGVTTDLSSVIKPSDELLLDVNDFLRQFPELLVFDYFQWQLLKIFISILVTLVFMIFCAWWVYGARITESFMDPGHKIDDRNNFKYYSPHL